MTLRSRLPALALSLLLALAAASPAEDFRVENKVFSGGESEACAESTTIFFNGAVYDFMKKPAEVIVFEKDFGRFVLLDTERRKKTELTSREVEAFTERLRQRAAVHDNPFVAFQADPKFEQKYDASARELTFSSPWMTYRVVTVDAESGEIARQYREFADWQARLNTVISHRSPPPFARIAVNAELGKREAVPSEVHLTATPGGFPRKRTAMHSEHQLIRRVVESDRARVQQIGQFMAIFQPVSFEEYQKIDGEKE
jgi:hypothetical protein